MSKILNILIEVGEEEGNADFIEIPINTQTSNSIKKILNEGSSSKRNFEKYKLEQSKKNDS